MTIKFEACTPYHPPQLSVSFKYTRFDLTSRKPSHKVDGLNGPAPQGSGSARCVMSEPLLDLKRADCPAVNSSLLPGAPARLARAFHCYCCMLLAARCACVESLFRATSAGIWPNPDANSLSSSGPSRERGTCRTEVGRCLPYADCPPPIAKGESRVTTSLPSGGMDYTGLVLTVCDTIWTHWSEMQALKEDMTPFYERRCLRK